MNIEEANQKIINITKNNQSFNVCWRLETSYRGGIYLKLDITTHKSSTIGNPPNEAHIDGIKTVEEIASFLMTEAHKKRERFSIRKSCIKVYRDIWKRNILKLIVNHNVSTVYFKDFIECEPIKLQKL